MITQSRTAKRNCAGYRRFYYGPAPLISTWLTARERSRVEVLAPSTQVRLHHHGALRSMLGDLADATSSTVLISIALVTQRDVATMTCLYRRYPEVSFVGVAMDANEATLTEGSHALGLAGIPALVDARTPNGQSELRNILHPDHGAKPFTRRALDEIALDLEVERQDTAMTSAQGRSSALMFFAAVFSQRHRTVRQVAAALGISASTLLSRFFRAQLPSPKRYLTLARLAWAAHLGEEPSRTVSEIALRLKASSPQSFCRTVRDSTGMTFTELRSLRSGSSLLEEYRKSLVLPYLGTWRSFDPLKAT